jgi:hypothetical protein
VFERIVNSYFFDIKSITLLHFEEYCTTDIVLDAELYRARVGEDMVTEVENTTLPAMKVPTR